MRKLMSALLCLPLFAMAASVPVYAEEWEDTSWQETAAVNPYYGGWGNCTWSAWQLANTYAGVAHLISEVLRTGMTVLLQWDIRFLRYLRLVLLSAGLIMSAMYLQSAKTETVSISLKADTWADTMKAGSLPIPAEALRLCLATSTSGNQTNFNIPRFMRNAKESISRMSSSQSPKFRFAEGWIFSIR